MRVDNEDNIDNNEEKEKKKHCALLHYCKKMCSKHTEKIKKLHLFKISAVVKKTLKSVEHPSHFFQLLLILLVIIVRT